MHHCLWLASHCSFSALYSMVTVRLRLVCLLPQTLETRGGIFIPALFQLSAIKDKQQTNPQKTPTKNAEKFDQARLPLTTAKAMCILKPPKSNREKMLMKEQHSISYQSICFQEQMKHSPLFSKTS